MRLGISVTRYGLYVVSTDMRYANSLYLPSVRNERGDSPRGCVSPNSYSTYPTTNYQHQIFVHHPICMLQTLCFFEISTLSLLKHVLDLILSCLSL